MNRNATRRTWNQPHFRLKLLSRPCWDIHVCELGDGGMLGYYMFVMTKRKP